MSGTELDALALVRSCIVASWGDEAPPSFARTSSFAELGADSVRVVEIVHHVECRLACEFSEEQLLALTSIDDLCRLVEATRRTDAAIPSDHRAT
ncbi:MAG: acyl carrier protein [Gammaproteobacteria bacterium]|nr:MAG: acyl carrier protein [Gammaproteobacteria bacterium]